MADSAASTGANTATSASASPTTEKPSRPQHAAGPRGLLAAFFTQPQVTGGSYFQLIDLMRGLAALIVIFWHYQHFFYQPGATSAVTGFRTQQPFHDELALFYAHGKYAVQLFWVISGFVFTHVYHGRRSTTRAFVVNRFARLYPLHLLTLLLVAGLQAVAQLRFGHYLVYQENSLGNFLLHLGLASNWWPTITYSFNAPIWSVSIELLVYAIFWVTLPILFRAGIVLPLLMAVGCIAACFYFDGYILLACAACFFTGATIFALHAARASWLSLILMAALVWVGSTAWTDGLDMRHYIAVPAYCAALVLLVAMLEPSGRAAGLQKTRWLGDASYGIYLWHFPVQLMLFLTVPGLATDHQAARNPAFLLLFLALVIALAVLSFRYFESPVRHRLRRALEQTSTSSRSTP